MNEVLKDLIRQKRQLDKTQKFLKEAIKSYVPKELNNSIPEGMILKTLKIIGDLQGNCKYSVAIPFGYEGKLEGYFRNGEYLNNDLDNYSRYEIPVLSITAPEKMLVFDERANFETFAQWIPFADYFKAFKLEVF
jgi:hypothetical protein